MARAATIVYLRAGDEFSVREYPAVGVGSTPAVSVDLVEGDRGEVWLHVSDPAAFDGLIAALAQAQDWLTGETSGQPSLPVVPEPEPVGNTGLTLHPLPVGEP